MMGETGRETSEAVWKPPDPGKDLGGGGGRVSSRLEVSLKSTLSAGDGVETEQSR